MPLPLREVPSGDDLADLMRGAGTGDITSVRTVLTLFRISRDLYEVMERFFAGFGVSDGRYSVLMLLRSADRRELQPSEIADRLAVTRGTITGLLKRLERDGYVSRGAFPGDGRRDVIKLSRKGAALLKTMMPKLAARHEASTAGLTHEERLTLIALLAKLNVMGE